jgi:hypothetical protein
MTHTVDPHALLRARGEQAAFDHLVERIERQFPELDQEVIVATVRGEYGRFETSPIRDFVPILVERSVQDKLSHPAHRA